MTPLTKDELDTIIAQALDLESEPFPELVFDPSELEIDWEKAPAPLAVASASAPAPARSTLKISIRVPARTLAAFKARAAATSGRYQSLMLEALKTSVSGWGL